MQHSQYKLHADNSHHSLQQDPCIGLLILPVLVERERVLGLILVNLVEDEKVGGHTLSTMRRPSAFWRVISPRHHRL